MLSRRLRLSRTSLVASVLASLLTIATTASVFAGNGQGPWP